MITGHSVFVLLVLLNLATLGRRYRHYVKLSYIPTWFLLLYIQDRVMVFKTNPRKKTLLFSQKKARRSALGKLNIQCSSQYRQDLIAQNATPSSLLISMLCFCSLRIPFTSLRFPGTLTSAYLNSTFPSRPHLPIGSHARTNI